MSPYQKEIIQFVFSKGTATTAEIIDKFGARYYANGAKHVQDAIGRMVNKNYLTRISHGIYKASSGSSIITIDDSQMKLFK